MHVVLDANILFSALIKDSTTRKLILEYEGIFLFPEYIFEEAEKHKDEIFRKSEMSADEFNKLLALLLRKVIIVPSEVLEPHRQEAHEIVKNIDINDTLFVACALLYKGSIIWSNDSQLKKQQRIKVINTVEAMELL
mgnify:CR=1 FL=1